MSSNSLNVNNNNVMNVFKVSDEVMSRLFNHKPFIFGEIRFIIKEFEESRHESDLNKLTETLDRITDFKDSKMDFAIDSCHRFNDKLNTCVQSLENLMKEIVGLESEQSSLRNDVLSRKREQRNNELIDLIELSKQRTNQIDESFEEQEKNLTLFYEELENKLKINQKV